MFTHVLTLCAGLALGVDGTAQTTRPTNQQVAPATTPQATSPAATTKAQPVAETKKKVVAKTVSYFPVELEVVKATNAERARHGLPALQLDPNLVQTARKHTWWMTRNRTMQHGNYPVAENIAMGQNSSGEVVRAWMNSSGHRANILNGGHRRIGVAAYTSSNGTVYWCQQFTR